MYKLLTRVAVIAGASIALAGCFDLTQALSIDSHGAGEYRTSIAAADALGEGLKSGKSDIVLGQNKNVATSTVIANDLVTRTSTIAFQSLSDLSLSAETVHLKVLGHSFFGLGPAHVMFHRAFKVRDAKRRQMHDDNDKTGQAVIASMFGNHFYAFSVSLPGSIDWIAPVTINGITVVPQITDSPDGGHTVIWRMPLTTMLEVDRLDFSVGFSAYGDFSEAESKPAKPKYT